MWVLLIKIVVTKYPRDKWYQFNAGNILRIQHREGKNKHTSPSGQLSVSTQLHSVELYSVELYSVELYSVELYSVELYSVELHMLSSIVLSSIVLSSIVLSFIVLSFIVLSSILLSAGKRSVQFLSAEGGDGKPRCIDVSLQQQTNWEGLQNC